MKLFHPCAVFKLVLSGEYFLVRKAAVFDWQQSTMHMRVQFVKVYDECGDVLLAIFATHE